MSKLPLRAIGSAALALAGCYTGSTPTTKAPSNTVAPTAATGIVISETAIGMIDASTPATLDALRQKLLGYEVKAERPDSGTLQFDVFKDGEQLFYVVEDASHPGKVLNAHTTSPKVTVAAHSSWHVGTAFGDAKQLSQCDCWGEKIVCWKDGEHVAAAFDRGCENMTGHENVRSLIVLDGIPIQRMIWNPKPFGAPEPAEAPRYKMEKPRGGGLSGTVTPSPHGAGGNPCGGDSDDDPCGD